MNKIEENIICDVIEKKLKKINLWNNLKEKLEKHKNKDLLLNFLRIDLENSNNLENFFNEEEMNFLINNCYIDNYLYIRILSLLLYRNKNNLK